jgi:hypothetical protein
MWSRMLRHLATRNLHARTKTFSRCNFHNYADINAYSILSESGGFPQPSSQYLLHLVVSGNKPRSSSLVSAPPPVWLRIVRVISVPSSQQDLHSVQSHRHTSTIVLALSTAIEFAPYNSIPHPIYETDSIFNIKQHSVARKSMRAQLMISKDAVAKDTFGLSFTPTLA